MVSMSSRASRFQVPASCSSTGFVDPGVGEHGLVEPEDQRVAVHREAVDALTGRRLAPGEQTGVEVVDLDRRLRLGGELGQVDEVLRLDQLRHALGVDVEGIRRAATGELGQQLGVVVTRDDLVGERGLVLAPRRPW